MLTKSVGWLGRLSALPIDDRLDRPPRYGTNLPVLPPPPQHLCRFHTKLRDRDGRDFVLSRNLGGGHLRGDECPGDKAPDDSYSEGRGTFGPFSLKLRIGPVWRCVSPVSETPGGRAPPAIQPVRRGGEPRPTARVTASGGVDQFMRLRCDGCARPLVREPRTGKPSTLWSYEFAGRPRPTEGRASIALVEGAATVRSRYGEFPACQTAFLHSREGGVLLHASGVSERRRSPSVLRPRGRGKKPVTNRPRGEGVERACARGQEGGRLRGGRHPV